MSRENCSSWTRQMNNIFSWREKGEFKDNKCTIVMISNSKLEKCILFFFFYRSVSQSWRPFLQGNLVILSRSLCSVLEKKTIHVSIDFAHYNFNSNKPALLLIRYKRVTVLIVRSGIFLNFCHAASMCLHTDLIHCTCKSFSCCMVQQ